jgi:hypothetical protein
VEHGRILEEAGHLVGSEGVPDVDPAGGPEEVAGGDRPAGEVVEPEGSRQVEWCTVEVAEVDGVGVVDGAAVEQSPQPRLPAHEPHRVAPDHLEPVAVEHGRRRVEVGDEAQPRLEVGADDAVRCIVTLDQVDGAVAGNERPGSGRRAQAEAAEWLDVDDDPLAVLDEVLERFDSCDPAVGSTR